jgi:manganese transport system ATP-binding protein
MPEPPAVECRDVTVARGDRVALRDADLTLPAAAVTALVGPNGSGKSTLLHAVAGLLPVRSGELRVLGSTPAAARARVAYVLQSTAVNRQLPLTVREVVALGRAAVRGAVGRLRREDHELVDRSLERLDLTDLARRHLGELSGGQRQRAVVAQGLAQDADVLLLDEPVSGLDLPSQDRIRRVIAEERAAGRAVVVATHDLGEAAAADHVALLAGRVVASGPPASTLTADHLRAAYGGRLLQLDGGVVILDEGSHHHEVWGVD